MTNQQNIKLIFPDQSTGCYTYLLWTINRGYTLLLWPINRGYTHLLWPINRALHPSPLTNQRVAHSSSLNNQQGVSLVSPDQSTGCLTHLPWPINKVSHSSTLTNQQVLHSSPLTNQQGIKLISSDQSTGVTLISPDQSTGCYTHLPQPIIRVYKFTEMQSRWLITRDGPDIRPFQYRVSVRISNLPDTRPNIHNKN